MKSVLAVLLLSVVAVAQTNNFVAKFLNGTLTNSSIVAVNGNVGIGTKTPTQRFQVNFGDALVSGYQNFTASGNIARYYVGDTNHIVGAAYGSGLFFSTYQAPAAMVITDGRPNAVGVLAPHIGIGNSNPGALLTVGGLACNYNDFSCPQFLNVGQGALTVDDRGQVSINNGFIRTALIHQSAVIIGVDTTVQGALVAVQGITFPDGTVQTTACQPTTVAATSIKRSMRKVRR